MLNDGSLMQRGGAHICAMQSLRPDRGWDDPDEETGRKVLNLIESLEDLEDVKSVHGNYDMDQSLLEAISG